MSDPSDNHPLREKSLTYGMCSILIPMIGISVGWMIAFFAQGTAVGFAGAVLFFPFVLGSPVCGLYSAIKGLALRERLIVFAFLGLLLNGFILVEFLTGQPPNPFGRE